MPFRTRILSIVFLALALSVSAGPEAGSAEDQALPTHADAAFIIVKYSGLFDRYGLQDATLNECVAFLNEHGVYFGLLEVVSGKEFTLKDCARVMGQIRLVFSGDADYLGGKVMLPKDVDSWETFCIMNEIRFVEAYEAIRNAVQTPDEISR